MNISILIGGLQGACFQSWKHLGNAMNFENVEKSFMTASFMSHQHMIVTNKAAFDTLAADLANYAVEPSWKNVTCLMGDAIMSSFR